MQTGDDIVEDEGKPYNIRYRCFHFAKDVINLVKEVEWERVFGSMFDQLVRSSTSIGANIIEGSAGSSKKDWLRFLNIALKSSNETKYRLCLIRDTMSINEVRTNELIKEADELSKIIASIIINATK